MCHMTIFGQPVSVTCGNAISEHGVPYLSRELTIRLQSTDWLVSVRVYPKTATIAVAYTDDRSDTWESDRMFFRLPVETYKQNAAGEIERAINEGKRMINEGDHDDDEMYRSMYLPDEGDH